jgi:L-asparaginase
MSALPAMGPRPVTVLATGGTIAMRGLRASPGLDGAALVATVRELAAVGDLRVRTLLELPGAHLGMHDALAVARAAIAEARSGRGVVVTHGTDTLEETAMLTDLLYDGDAPIVFTGAVRPASATSADGPGNIAAAARAAAAGATAGHRVLVAFAGELHRAATVRKIAANEPCAFGSPLRGPAGRVAEDRVVMHDLPPRRPRALDPVRVDGVVPIVPTWMGDDGGLLRAAADMRPDGIVFVALGAGHVPIPVIEALEGIAGALPVVATTRPERGSILRATYGFRGSEADVRHAGVICAGALSAQAARVKLLACLGAGLSPQALREAFADDDR